MNQTQPAEIWIGRGDDRLGPHTFEKFRDLHADGRLQRDDLIWWDGLAEWVALDAAAASLGFARTAPVPAPLPPTRRPDLPPRPASTTDAAEGAKRTRAIGFAFSGLITFAVLAAAAFAYLRAPKLGLALPGTGRAEIADVLSAASMYKVAYAEHVMTHDEAPKSLEELGLSSASFGALQGVRIEGGTLLFDTSRGVLAMQPFRNANYQILFRCGLANPPAGMTPLGGLDAAAFTTVAASDLPEDCR